MKQAQGGEVTCRKPPVPLTLASHQGPLPDTFSTPSPAPPRPHLTFPERQAAQQGALGSGGSWQAVGGHPKGNSFSSGAGRGLLAGPEAILGSQVYATVGRRPAVEAAEGRGEFCLASRSLMTLSLRRLVWFNVTAESQQGWGRNYPLWCKKSPGW